MFGILFVVFLLVKFIGSFVVMGGDINYCVMIWVGWVVVVMVSLFNVMLIYFMVIG